jgi:hypothetical protein
MNQDSGLGQESGGKNSNRESGTLLWFLRRFAVSLVDLFGILPGQVRALH